MDRSIFDSLLSELDVGLASLSVGEPSAPGNDSSTREQPRGSDKPIPPQHLDVLGPRQSPSMLTPPPSPSMSRKSMSARRGSANSAGAETIASATSSTLSTSPLSPYAPDFDAADMVDAYTGSHLRYRDVVSSDAVLFLGSLFKLEPGTTSTWKLLHFVLVSDDPHHQHQRVLQQPALLAFPSAREEAACTMSMDLNAGSTLRMESLKGSGGTEASIITVIHPAGWTWILRTSNWTHAKSWHELLAQ
ncbi:hypothetical protein HK101_007164, partial [Irineochytrium annulatum]